MKTLPRYFALIFFRNFLAALGLLTVLIMMGDIFDRLNALLESPGGIAPIMKYLALKIPYWAVKIVPAATLLSTLFTVSGLSRTGEWMAAQSSGYSPGDLIKPVLGCALAVAIGGFIAQETVLPLCYAKARKTYREDIRHWPPRRTRWSDVVLIGRPGQFLVAKVFDLKEGSMERVVMDVYSDLVLVRQIDALGARWESDMGRWVFFDGVQRVFRSEDPSRLRCSKGPCPPGEGGPAREFPFSRLVSDLDVSPVKLVPQEGKPDEMSLYETYQHIGRLSHLGASRKKAWVAFHSKIAYPFSNLVVCALGIPFALRIRRGGRAFSFAGALGISFIFWWLSSFGESLGAGGWLPPFVGAWMANFLFGLAAFVGVRRI